ncbi:TPA: hypothetical protein N3552_000467 [Klebsiella variicola]|nr:hypothetical protein [Klebsiella variicola]
MAKLTKKESAWFDEVNAVLARCPSPEKFGFYTIGDLDVSVYDKRKEIARKLDARSSSDWCIAVRDAEAEIDAHIYFPSAVLSTAG